MATNKILIPQLAQRIKHLIDRSKSQAQIALEQIAAETFWKIGQLLHQHKIQTTSASTFRELSSLTDVDFTQLNRALQFYLTWPKACPIKTHPNLTWSHFKLLLPLAAEDRKKYLKAANRENWAVRLLSQKIKEPEPDLLEPPLKDQAKKLKRSTNRLHIYTGKVNRIVDGDTFDLDIDLGFDVWIKRRIRLRGINTQELGRGKDALDAKAFVEERLTPDVTIAIQTFKVDLHGRYVCDVFYLPRTADKETITSKGRFLNQELLNAGLAVLM